MGVAFVKFSGLPAVAPHVREDRDARLRIPSEKLRIC